METQRGNPRRSLQRLRPLPGSGNARTNHSSCRSHRNLRHGWPLNATNVAVHSSFRQKNRRLAPGKTTKTLIQCTIKHVSL